MSQRVGPGNTRKRGHQHHPRNNGTRRRTALEPTGVPDIPATPSKPNITTTAICGVPSKAPTTSVITSASSEISAPVNKENQANSDIIDLTNCDDDQKDPVTKSNKNEINKKLRKPSKCDKEKDMSLVYRPAAEGSSQSDQEAEDPETEELARLRCTSERTEVVAERETRRRNRRCADYPGLAFGSSIFSSDTLMKFSIIRNELHNIMNTQLRRVCPTTNRNVAISHTTHFSIPFLSKSPEVYF